MTISGNAAVAAEWVLVIFALVFVCLRGYVRIYRNEGPTLSDGFVLLAWLAFLGLFAPGRTYEMALTTINPDPDKTIEALKIIYGSALPYYTDLWLVKAALLAFYFQIIPVTHKRLRSALYLLTGLTVATYIMVMGLNSFFCQPISSNWSLSTEDQCINSPQYAVFFPSVISNIVIDLLIFTLPFFLIRQLHIPEQQRWRLVFIFSLGGLAIFMSIARIIALAASAETTQVAVWTALECSIAIVVACCPALRPLLRRPGVVTSASSNPERWRQSKGDSEQEWTTTVDGVVENTFEEQHTEDGVLVAPPSNLTIMKKEEFEIASARANEVGSNSTYTEAWASRT